MKFGKNLTYLSIPEWKSYNIDYNDLKAQIRNITLHPNTNQTNLTSLYHSFVSNFDYINLFVHTKAGELGAKLTSAHSSYQSICQSSLSNTDKYVQLNELHYFILFDISTTLTKLIKFITIQKIAIKKILKKFIKYSQFDLHTNSQFVASLNHYLYSNPQSLVNYNLSPLTQDLTDLINVITTEQASLDNHRATPSICSATTNNTTTTTNITNLDTHPLHHDLQCLLKKNFKLDFFIPNDANTTNDLQLNLDVYINLKLVNRSTVSFIYLTNDSTLDCKPSFVVSHQHSAQSLVVAHTGGGLRDYTYCLLENSTVTMLLQFLNGDLSLEPRLKSALRHESSPLSKSAIDTIMSKHLKPTLQLVCDRHRYFVDKDFESDTASTSSNRRKSYQDDYWILFDANIFTTNNPDLSLGFGHEGYEPFPFNHLMVISNDSNLYDFEANLSTVVRECDFTIDTKYRPTFLNKLPAPVQSLITNKFGLCMLKNVSFYEYMKSCYFNKIPAHEYNHFAILLKLNLMKNWEHVEEEDRTLDRQLLKRQLSFKSLSSKNFNQPQSRSPSPSLLPSIPSTVSNSYHSAHIPPMYYQQQQQQQQPELASTPTQYKQHDIITTKSILSYDEHEDYTEQDNYLLFLKLNHASFNDSFLTHLIYTIIKFRARLYHYTMPNTVYEKTPLKPRFDLEYNYDSINDDEITYYDHSYNSMQHQFEHDHDNILTFLYFSLNLVALFIVGIDVGIIYSLTHLQNLTLGDNWIISIVLVGGLFTSLIASMLSIMMGMSRFEDMSRRHCVIVWGSFVMCVMSVMYGVVAICS